MSNYQTAFDGTFAENVGSTTSSFEDFLSAIGQEVPAQEDVKEVEVNEEHEEIETEDYNSEDDFENMFGEETEEEVEEDEESDETDEEVEEDTEEETDEEVDFGELEIDLDSEIQIGEEFISVNDLIRNRMDAEEIKTQREEIEAKVKAYDEKEATVVGVLEKAKLECDKVIEDYKEFDWKKMAQEDPKAYAEHREFLEAYLARKEEIDEDYATAVKAKEAKELEVKQAAANDCLTLLKKDIPNWNEDLYQNIMGYAIEKLGMSQDFVTASMDAGFFKTVYGVMKRDSDLKTAVTKVRNKAVKKVAKSSGGTASKKAAVKKSSNKVSASAAGVSSHDAGAFEEFSKLGLF